MVRPRTNFAGRRHGMLTYIRDTGLLTPRGHTIWLARCDCGREVNLPTTVMARQQSCGCLVGKKKEKK